MAELSANGRNDETNADLFSKTATEARSQSLEDALAHARTNKYWPPSLRFVSPADKERYLIICLRGWVRKTEDGSWSVLLRLRRTKRRLTGEGESFNKKDCIIYNWPGSTVEMAWRFVMVQKILAELLKAQISKQRINKREIYYNNPNLFGEQSRVDRYIDDIAYTLGVTREDLFITASLKGLVAGKLDLSLVNGPVLSRSTSPQAAILVPAAQDIASVTIRDVNWILVIEKETVFRRLSGSEFWKTASAGPGILVTGKGYPDLHTRHFVRRLADTISQLAPLQVRPKICMLADFDPDGLCIMNTYKYSRTTTAADGSDHHSTALIAWLGVQLDNISQVQLMPLTVRDRRLAICMLKDNPSFLEDGPEPEWRRALQTMLLLNGKAEIEFLYQREQAFEIWLEGVLAKSPSQSPITRQASNPARREIELATTSSVVRHEFGKAMELDDKSLDILDDI